MVVYHTRSAFLLLSLVLTLYAWARIGKPRGRVFDLVGSIALLSLGIELNGYVSTLRGINNTIWYNGFAFVEFYLVVWMLSKDSGCWLTFLSAIIGGVAIIHGASQPGSGDQLLIATILVLSALISVLLLHALWKVAQNSSVPIQQQPVFWLYTGMLMYFGGIIPMVGATRVLGSNEVLVTQLWTIIPFLCVGRYLLTALACWLMVGPRRSRP